MRVIAGTAGGRRLVAPAGHRTRPTADRVREALFASLQPHLPGAAVLDLFAGSGALAIEALSRGAATATLVESTGPALAAIRVNLDTAGVTGRAHVVAGRLPGVLDRLEGAFDLVLLDPPYELDRDVLAAVLDQLPGRLAPDALVCLEQSSRAQLPAWPSALHPTEVRSYGATSIHRATRSGEPTGEGSHPPSRSPT